MDQTNPVRKSGRQRVPNKRYAVDAFEGLDILSSDSEVDLEVLQQLQDSKNDDDFPENNIEGNDDEESLADEVSDGSAILTPEEEYEDAHSYASSDPEEPDLRGTSKGKKRKLRNYTSNQDVDVHSRGMLENTVRADYERSRVEWFSGSGVEDIVHVIRSRDQWAAEPTLPCRLNMCHQVSHTDEKRQMEATVGWDWYYDQGGRESFAEKQKVRTLSIEESVAYVPKPTHSSHSFLMGPYGRQKVFTLALSQTQGLEEACDNTSGLSEQHSEEFRSSKTQRLGWMLNVGTRVRCLDWAPNHYRNTQYLALAVAQASISTRAATPIEAPAFTPSCPAPSSVQIWAFDASNNSMNSTRPPELQQVLCTDWGEITQLKWCPVPRTERNEDTLGKISIGLLAGIWGDGCARVLDVQLEKGQAANTSYCKFTIINRFMYVKWLPTIQTKLVKVQSAAFLASSRLLPLAGTEQEDIRPVTTCLTWLSATDLAVGYSNGALGIYNIYPQLSHSSLPNLRSNSSVDLGARPSSPTPTESNSLPEAANGGSQNPSLPSFGGYDLVDATKHVDIEPWLFLQLHSTYVLSLTTAYPTHPALLISSSLSGNLRLTSLRAPTTDYVLSTRTRTPPSSLAYCDSLLSVVALEESSQTLRLWALRYFYSSLACGKLGSAPGPGQGIVDVGRCHSSIAAGGADGSVIITNPMRKALGRKDAGWQQVVFKHEWVRRPGQGPRQGMSRITEGYQGEKVDLSMKHGRNAKDSVTESTIYEDETAVTALGWNPNNSGCGGWLAVGWGSGLLRIQDMAV
ncbi:MAG: hypothetical protein Q9161_006058 [Pseudevernia consocians]